MQLSSVVLPQPLGPRSPYLNKREVRSIKTSGYRADNFQKRRQARSLNETNIAVHAMKFELNFFDIPVMGTCKKITRVFRSSNIFGHAFRILKRRRRKFEDKINSAGGRRLRSGFKARYKSNANIYRIVFVR